MPLAIASVPAARRAGRRGTRGGRAHGGGPGGSLGEALWALWLDAGGLLALNLFNARSPRVGILGRGTVVFPSGVFYGGDSKTEGRVLIR